jgi:hypothetical protein
LGYNRFLNPVLAGNSGQDWPSKLGIKGVGGNGAMPVFSFSSDSYPALSSNRWDRSVEENIMFRDTLSYLHGRHNWKIGFESRSQWIKTRSNTNQNGTLTFNFKETASNASTATGNAFASFLLGYVDSASIATGLNVASRRPFYAAFVQDDFKVNSRLTLNLGLRYELELPPYEAYDRASRFDFDTPNPAAGNQPGALVFAGSGSGRIGSRTFEDPHYLALAPRVGLAYQLSSNTVIRAGYGVSYSSNRLLNTYDGFSTTGNFISPDNGNTPAFRLDDGMPTNFPKPPIIDPGFDNNNNTTTTVKNDAARMGMTQIWRLDVQRQLPGGVLLEGAYVGTRGTHLNAQGLRNFNQVDASYLALGSLLTADINSAAARAAGIPIPYPGFRGTVSQALRPFPQVLTITSTEDKLGSANYNSLQLKLQKRFSGGLQYVMSYTNSKTLTDVQGGLQGIDSSSLQDAGNRRAEWAVANYDTPQNFWIGMVYELPFGRGKPLAKTGCISKLAGGWSLAPILTYQSGVPLTPTRGNSLPIFNSGQRPNRVPGVAARNDIAYSDFDPAVARIFNPAAFAAPAPYTFGNAAPRLADARGYGIRNEDLSLRKTTRVRERFLLDINAQAFDLPNRPEWGRAVIDTSSSDFGKITKAGPSRFVQICVKLSF